MTRPLILIASLTLFVLPPLTLGQESGTLLQQSSSGVSIAIVQESPRNTFGSWILLLPGGAEQQKNSQVSRTLYHFPTGLYTIFTSPPEGAIAGIHLQKQGDLPEIVDRPQATFRLEEGEHMDIRIEYSFTRVGIVAVHSDPAGLEYEMWGPDKAYYTGTTPQSYPDAPEGQYSVQFKNIAGCRVPARKSLFLTKNSRITFSVRVECEEASRIREEQKDRQSGGEKFVTVTIEDGTTVIFRDVPQISWFAIYIFNTARLGVISGYRSADGNLTETYGPGNPVTIAELAKVAHKIAGIPPTNNRRPENMNARNQWFSPFIASAEQLGWTIFNDATINPVRPALRGEVLVTLLQALDVPLRWQKGDAFTDVTSRTLFSAAIETAAGDGIVSGHTDDFGSPTGTFGPKDPVNRAELAKILDRMIDVYKKGEGVGDSF